MPAASAQDRTIEVEAAKQTAEDFLSAMRKADKSLASSLVAATAYDEFELRFDRDSNRLRAAPMPRFIFAAPLKSHSSDPVESEANLLYAIKDDGEWTTVTLRLYRYDSDPFRIEYWKIENNAPNILAISGDPALREFPAIMRWAGLGIALSGLMLIGIIIWLVRRKPQLVAPDREIDSRAVAVTRRERDD